MSENRMKAELGFEGGQVLPIRLTEQSLKDLRSALEAGSGWIDLGTEDGTVVIDLARVVFVRVNTGGQRVGF